MSKLLSFSLCVCTAGLAFTATDVAGAAELTARDLRMETRTQWDYQPMQGPRYSARDRDMFTPGTAQNDAAQDPPAPPPVLEPGDWRDNPPRAEEALPPKQRPKDPRTETSLELGIQGSSYQYHEKDLGVSIDGPQFGVQVIATGALEGQWFLRADGRVSGGSHEYEGSGTMDTNPNYEAEARLTLGRDFVTRNYGIAPYVGVGYRYLHSDIRGITNVGALGYQRDNHLLFAPIGVQPKIQFPNGDRLSMTLEYDPILQGWQDSFLSDVYYGYPDLSNKQTEGYGLRGEVTYHKDKWSFGPYLNYWNINESKEKCASNNDGSYLYTICGVEPHNHTLEFGLQLRYRFMDANGAF